jgi:hypothetical protein
MRSLAGAFPDEAFVQEALAQITWYHAITLLDKVADPAARAWYIRQAIAQGWSRGDRRQYGPVNGSGVQRVADEVERVLLTRPWPETGRP